MSQNRAAPAAVLVAIAAQTSVSSLVSAAGTRAADDDVVTAPLPGTLVAVSVSAGDSVVEGDVLGVLESMKMEYPLKAQPGGQSGAGRLRCRFPGRAGRRALRVSEEISEGGKSTLMRCAYDGLPERVTVYEVGPRDGLQNEPGVGPLETKLELIARLVSRRPERGGGDEPRAARHGATTGRRRGTAGPAALEPRRAVPRPRAEPPRSRPSPGDWRAREVALFASATETFARRNLNRCRAESHAHLRGGRPRRQGGGPVSPWLRLDVFRGSLGGRGRPRPGGGGGSELLGMGCAGGVPRGHDRSGDARGRQLDAQPAGGSRCRAPQARSPLPRHLRPGARQHPGGPAQWGDDGGRLRRRARGVPFRRERNGQPCYRRPRVPARRARDPDWCGPRRPWLAPACGWPVSSAGRARAGPCRRWRGAWGR